GARVTSASLTALGVVCSAAPAVGAAAVTVAPVLQSKVLVPSCLAVAPAELLGQLVAGVEACCITKHAYEWKVFRRGVSGLNSRVKGFNSIARRVDTRRSPVSFHAVVAASAFFHQSEPIVPVSAETRQLVAQGKIFVAPRSTVVPAVAPPGIKAVSSVHHWYGAVVRADLETAQRCLPGESATPDAALGIVDLAKPTDAVAAGAEVARLQAEVAVASGLAELPAMLASGAAASSLDERQVMLESPPHGLLQSESATWPCLPYALPQRDTSRYSGSPERRRAVRRSCRRRSTGQPAGQSTCSRAVCSSASRPDARLLSRPREAAAGRGLSRLGSSPTVRWRSQLKPKFSERSSIPSLNNLNSIRWLLTHTLNACRENLVAPAAAAGLAGVSMTSCAALRVAARSTVPSELVAAEALRARLRAGVRAKLYLFVFFIQLHDPDALAGCIVYLQTEVLVATLIAELPAAESVRSIGEFAMQWQVATRGVNEAANPDYASVRWDWAVYKCVNSMSNEIGYHCLENKKSTSSSCGTPVENSILMTRTPPQNFSGSSRQVVRRIFTAELSPQWLLLRVYRVIEAAQPGNSGRENFIQPSAAAGLISGCSIRAELVALPAAHPLVPSVGVAAVAPGAALHPEVQVAAGPAVVKAVALADQFKVLVLLGQIPLAVRMMNGNNSGGMWHPPAALPRQQPVAVGAATTSLRLRSARPTQRGQPGLLTWRRAQTPFCADDRALKAYRHSQNPRKPPPPPQTSANFLEAAPQQLLRRPGTAAPMMEQRRLAYQSNQSGLIDSDIIDWVRSASVNEKQLAYKLMRCLALASGEDAAVPAEEDFNAQQLPAAVSAPVAPLPQPPQILSIDRQPVQIPRPFTPIRDQRLMALQRQLFSNRGGPQQVAADARTDPQALFGTMGDNEFRRAKREQLARMQAAACGDYAYPGAGFLNARPAQRPTFCVHPEWVSEKYARLNTQQDGRL
uniref:Protein kinase domain-containing protein n=1 Tax=Macrostomum lignano TaxID=282301 RepID=A0A1I8HZ86_9PLAT